MTRNPQGMSIEVPLQPAKSPALRLRLPPDFVQSYKADRMMIWEVHDSSGRSSEFGRFRIFLGLQQGYPIVSIGGNAEQTELQECQLATNDGVIAVMLFMVKLSRPEVTVIRYVVANWEPKPGLVVQVLADGERAVAQARFLAALQTMEVVGP